MQDDLDHMLHALKEAPADRSLHMLADDVMRQLAERRVAGYETWRLRAAAVAMVTLSAVAVSALSTAAATPEASPFAAWSQLAPTAFLGSLP